MTTKASRIVLSDSDAWDLIASIERGEEPSFEYVRAFAKWADKRDEVARAYEMKGAA